MTRTNLLWKVQDVSVQRWLLGRDFWRNWCLLESIACQLHLRHKIDALFQRILTSNSQCCFLCCPFLWDYDGLCRVPKLGTAVSRTSFSGIKRHKDPFESETSQIAPFLPDEYQILSMPGPRRNPNNPSAAQNPARPWIAVPGQGQCFRHLLVGYMGWGWEVARHLGTNLDRFLPANKSGRRRQMYILYAWIPCSSHVHSFTYECFSSLHITNNFSLMVMVFTSPLPAPAPRPSMLAMLPLGPWPWAGGCRALRAQAPAQPRYQKPRAPAKCRRCLRPHPENQLRNGHNGMKLGPLMWIQDKCLTMSNSRTTRTSGTVEEVGWKCPIQMDSILDLCKHFRWNIRTIWQLQGAPRRTQPSQKTTSTKYQPSFPQLEVFLKGVISIIHVHFNGLSYLSGCIDWNVRPWHWLAWTEWSGCWCSRGRHQWPSKPRLRQHRPAHGNWWGGQGHLWQHWRRHAPHGGSH